MKWNFRCDAQRDDDALEKTGEPTHDRGEDEEKRKVEYLDAIGGNGSGRPEYPLYVPRESERSNVPANYALRRVYKR